jgi:hypothetical protein
MTASSTRSSARIERPARRRALAALAVLPWLWRAAPARADAIVARQAALDWVEDNLQLDADFDVQLNGTLEEALTKGVPLVFVLEFELLRTRWYWWAVRVASYTQSWRLSYNTLTRQFRLASGPVFQNFTALDEALAVLGRVRRRTVGDARSVSRGATYSAAVRLRFDTSQLPRPFQAAPFVNRDWNLAADWLRWQATL